MKNLAAVIITSILSLSATTNAQSKIDPVIKNKVLGAKAEAIKVMIEYSEEVENDLETRETVKLMLGLLEKAKTVSATGSTLKLCNEVSDTIAIVSWTSQAVSICPYGLSMDKNNLIQTFIHEAYHLYEGAYYMPRNFPHVYQSVDTDPDLKIKYPEVFRESEKKASIIELEIMRKTSGCVFGETAYFSELLGLTKNKDYRICN